MDLGMGEDWEQLLGESVGTSARDAGWGHVAAWRGQ